MLTRRGWMTGAASVGALTLTGMAVSGCGETFDKIVGLGKRVAEIQQRHGGRIGLSALVGTNNVLNITADERFAMCSTFKWVLAACVLQAVDQGKLSLTQPVAYGQKDLLDYAPITRAQVGKGKLTVAELCAASVSQSDNTAANLLFPLIGGPAGLTTWVRGLGDTITRFDRIEPDLNSNTDKDERDTTTPKAMNDLLKTVFTGTVLKADSLALLTQWMVGATTGADRIRAGVPAGYTVADKTGTGMNGAVNDVAVIWPPKKGTEAATPIFLSIYTSGGTLDDVGRNKVVADLAAVVFDMLTMAESIAGGDASSSVSTSS